MKANPNYTFLKRQVPKQRFTLLQGGTRSGKTFSTGYYILDLCRKYEGMEIDICRETFTALKSTVWKDFKSILVKHGLYNGDDHNKSDKTYTLFGNDISYYGLDDPAKVHGRSRDILWLNEAHQVDEETTDQLFPRTRHKVIMDYNPALPVNHWIDKYINDYPPLITTYKDNPHLTKAQILDIESKQNNPYWWSVYGCGERAQPVGAIFTNWIEGEFDTNLPYCYGQDYGFSVDPTTLIKVAVDSKRKLLYLDEAFWSTKGMSTDEIYQANMSCIHNPTDMIIGDSAEDRLIVELRHRGLNIVGAEKGPGSVRAGITRMLDYEIIVSPKSVNLKQELSNYVWNDKKSGIPVDAWNHGIDPTRYAFKMLDRPSMLIG